MRALQQRDIPGLVRILKELEAAGSFSAAEVDCALELLQIVLDQPRQTDYLVLVAETQGAAVGYILYGPVPLTSGNFDIYWIATDPQRHGAGFGRRRMSASAASSSWRRKPTCAGAGRG